MKKVIFSIMMCIMAVSAGNSAEMNAKADITNFPVKGITSVDIQTNSGLIDVKASQIAGIRVEQLPDNARVCDVTMKIKGKKLILKALVKEGNYSNIKTGFRIKLPSDIKIIAKSNSGDINIRNIEKNVNVEAKSGDIKIRNIAGSMEAKTNSGDINILKVKKNVKVEAKSGDIKIQNITGSVKAKTNSGDIALNNVSGGLEARTNSGDIKGIFKSTKTSKKVNLKTTSGDVSARFPKNSIITVDAETNSGKIHNEFSGKTGLPLTVKTTSGNISIVKNKK
ncbi:MAG: DUF4097 family beta strand repeat protein [Elusimicrobiales bacterium]|nr:DUF4097 family beta strand repeat protein [Elusimicrobiales bacterium]